MECRIRQLLSLLVMVLQPLLQQKHLLQLSKRLLKELQRHQAKVVQHQNQEVDHQKKEDYLKQSDRRGKRKKKNLPEINVNLPKEVKETRLKKKKKHLNMQVIM